MANHPSSQNGWELVFADEFNGSEVKTENWNTQYYYGSRTNVFNNELQYYVDDAFSFEDGVLSITAEKLETPIVATEPIDLELAASLGTPETFDYTSGLLSGHDKVGFTFGYMEIRAKLPEGQGLWPAFWMLPSADGAYLPEIDVLEVLGDDPTTAYQTLHYPNENYERQLISNAHSGVDFSQDFHDFAVKWTENKISWLIDGEVVFSTKESIPDETMYLIANLAVGGNWPGSPDETTLFPSAMEIDFVRVYQNAKGALSGGLADDVLTRERGTIYGLAGNDTLTLNNGGGLYGGVGNDVLQGGKSKNRLEGGDGEDELFGNGGQDVLLGGADNDVLDGGDGRDELQGEAGDDQLSGGRGQDSLSGGLGNDVVDGGQGQDSLTGVDATQAFAGLDEIDELIGGRGKDLFVLGDLVQVYYNDGDDTTLGLSDYALVADFGLGQDVIQLKGSATDYRLGAAPEGLALGTGIFWQTAAQEELIAVVAGDEALALDSAAFAFV